MTDSDTRVVFVLVPGLHLLDLAGPAQTLHEAGGFQPVYLAESSSVRSAQGVVLQTRTGWPRLRRTDWIVVPGWQTGGSTAVKLGTATLARIASHAAIGGRVVSVCAGALALAAAGILNGRRATTHHAVLGALARRWPTIRTIPDVLWVQDDNIWTSAGIASGIDLTLQLIATDRGPAAAAGVARAMVVAHRRNGDDSQHSATLRFRDHLSDLVHRTQSAIDARWDQALRLADLAATVGVSERTLTRAFTRACGITPLRYQQEIRLERAETLIGQGATVERAAAAVGFADARMLRRLRARAAA